MSRIVSLTASGDVSRAVVSVVGVGRPAGDLDPRREGLVAVRRRRAVSRVRGDHARVAVQPVLAVLVHVEDVVVHAGLGGGERRVPVLLVAGQVLVGAERVVDHRGHEHEEEHERQHDDDQHEPSLVAADPGHHRSSPTGSGSGSLRVVERRQPHRVHERRAAHGLLGLLVDGEPDLHGRDQEAVRRAGAASRRRGTGGDVVTEGRERPGVVVQVREDGSRGCSPRTYRPAASAWRRSAGSRRGSRSRCSWAASCSSRDSDPLQTRSSTVDLRFASHTLIRTIFGHAVLRFRFA